MDKTEPKYRRPLNKEQIQVLSLLFRFRFMTSEQFARYFNKTSSDSMHKRLKILSEQGFVAKHYDKSYKLKGRPAEYYLLPTGARLLRKSQGDRIIILDQSIKNIYKDKTASDTFMHHCIKLCNTYLQLTSLYKKDVSLFTRSQLNPKVFGYFPSSLPDAYIKLDNGKKEQSFFLDIFEDDTPFFVLIARIKKYLKYMNDGEWANATGFDSPSILMICESLRRTRQLQRRIAKELEDSYEADVIFGITTLDILLSNKDKKAWFEPGKSSEQFKLENLKPALL